MGKLDGKVAIVSGSGRGIGQAVALKLVAEGASVVINDLDAGPAEETVARITAAGGKAVACVGSVTAPDFAERFVKTAVEQLGGLHIIINNAGYTWDNVLQKMSDEQWYAMVDVHMTAPMRILRAASEYFRIITKKEAGEGKATHRKVVNISSIAGTGGNAGQVNYSAAKAGIIGVTRALSKEWGRYKVNVNCVAFGLINTRLTSAPADGSSSIEIEGNKIKTGVNPDLLKMMEAQIPLGRGGTPEEAAGAVAMLCYPESDYVSGEVIVCGGGFRV
ncbi:3-oxoacyl-[acyl-carrier protein] reductase [Panacagrimonas perspica]|uniref:3-oxoacyl-[acyl-carrier protein] reductase n=1 Tax=Panacagrimonas perspica TaxID=381431 RepID=A0A4R7P650_9GAMM|nr:SDR family oxidoreductase [Panacagrimonas perspica]TDU28510.1 3-oxoacyl-[acyl-carrier protein] reductase [Panacagrimonas perspica]THD00906.1 3-oxoacyl-ACP reductase [Panacagrimonas perspica]